MRPYPTYNFKNCTHSRVNFRLLRIAEGFSVTDEKATIPEGASFAADTGADVPTYDSYAHDCTLMPDFPSFTGEKSFDES